MSESSYWPVFVAAMVAASAAAAPARAFALEAPASNGAEPPRKTISERTAVATALQHNPSLASAVTEQRRAQLLEDALDHKYSFVLQVDGSATRTKNPSLGPSGVTLPESTAYVAGAELRRHLLFGTDLKLRLEGTRQTSTTLFVVNTANGLAPISFQMGPAYLTTVRLSLTQPLLRGAGRDVYYADLDAARASRLSAQSAQETAASQLLLDTLVAYWELYHASRAVEIQKKNLELAKTQRDEAAARVRTGSAAPVDVLSFETRIATIEEDVASARADERKRVAELARLIGTPDMAADAADTASTPGDPGPPPEDVFERTMQGSFELAKQRAALRLAEVQARTADEPYRSRLDLDAYVQASGLGNKDIPPAFDQLAGLGAVSAHVGLTYEAPLDGTQQRRERERASLAVASARQQLTAIEQRLRADVEKAVTQEEYSRRRVALATTTLDNAQRQLAAETEKFRTGSSTALQVREAEEQVRSAELRAGRARTDLVESGLTIEHLTGRLLERWSKATQ